ncbi:MAG: T9SS type A sorting domain-containing protein [Flavobacteriia bacterium]|nr:T9SS type A sorting domain-containing protein [Flavobacteriia bacterium]
MKKVLFSVFALVTGLTINAQVVFNVQSPANIVGNYEMSVTDPGGGWGSPDMTIPANAVTAELMFVEDGTPGTNAQGNPISREGCNTLINDLTGKIAVIYRNTCEFGAKVYNAQQAGAIAAIIVNREDEVIAMGPGADGANVTIPAIFISSSSGLLITTELNAGNTVTAFIGNKLGLFDNDMGILKNKLLIPSPNTNASILNLDASNNSYQIGAKIFNYGNESQSNYSLNATISFNGTTIYSETQNSTQILNTGDSAIIHLPNFSLSNYPIGKYTLTYNVLSNIVDEYPEDNIFSTDFYIHNNIFSYSSVVNDSVVTNSSYRTSAATSSFQSCIHFMHPNASSTELEGVSFSASVNDDMESQEFTIHVIKWNDVFTDMNSPEFTNLAEFAFEEVATTVYNMTSDLYDVQVYAPLTDIDGNPATLPLLDNQRYLVCVETFEDSTYIGYTNLDYDYTADTLNQPLSPVVSDEGTSIGGFVGSPAASIGLSLIPNTNIPMITTNAYTTFCEGQSIVLTSSISTGNQWKKDGANISGAINSTLTVTESGNYTVVSGGNESASITITVLNNPPMPTISVNGATTFCYGNEVVLTSDVTSNITWSNGTTEASQTINSSGVYMVTSHNDICSVSSTPVTITVNPLPVVEIQAPVFTVCQGSILELTAVGADNYVWSTTETTSVISVSPTVNTFYTVTGTDVNQCSNTATVEVIHVDQITISVDVSPIQCIGSEITLLASGADSYFWNGSTTSSNSYSFTPLNAGDEVINVNGILGTCTDDLTVTVSVNSLPTVNAGSDVSVCSGQSTVLSASGANTYVWDILGAGNDLTVNVVSTVTYTVVGTDNNGCSNSDDLTITALATPSITFDSNPFELCDNAGIVTLTNPTLVPSNSTGAYSGIGVSNGNIDPTLLSLGSNTISYEATSTDGCVHVEELEVLVENCSNINEVNNSILVSLFPNPANDYFIIELSSMTYNKAKIIDALGRVVSSYDLNSFKTEISTKELSNGLYNIIFIGNNESFIQKIQVRK